MATQTSYIYLSFVNISYTDSGINFFKIVSEVPEAGISLRRPIHIINPVDKTELSCNTLHRCSTTVSLET